MTFIPISKIAINWLEKLLTMSARREIILSVKRTIFERDKAMTILTFGKHKNELLETAPVSYIKWLATHKKVLGVENRHFSDLAKELLERRAQVVALKEFEALKEAEMAILVAEQLIRANVGTRAAHSPSRVFSLMR
jgi:hypothetical protein